MFAAGDRMKQPAQDRAEGAKVAVANGYSAKAADDIDREHRSQRHPVIPTRVPCSDAQLIASAEIEAKRLPAGAAVARTHEMPDERSRNVSNAKSSAPHPSREIEIFGVREQRCIEDVGVGGQRIE